MTSNKINILMRLNQIIITSKILPNIVMGNRDRIREFSFSPFVKYRHAYTIIDVLTHKTDDGHGV